jgi:hypothetical protein
MLPFLESDDDGRARCVWPDYAQEQLRRTRSQPGPAPARHPEPSAPDTGVEKPRQLETKIANGDSAIPQGHALFQEFFFFCAIKGIGDLPGSGCIYVETVVDRESGMSFAKVYPAKNGMNAVDILATRVMPYYDRRGIAIKEMHTRKTGEFWGLVPIHPFDTYLSTNHIEHLPIDEPGQARNYLCEEFYQFLLKEFFPSALRTNFRLSLEQMQKDLDAFVDAYNAMRAKRGNT